MTTPIVLAAAASHDALVDAIGVATDNIRWTTDVHCRQERLDDRPPLITGVRW